MMPPTSFRKFIVVTRSSNLATYGESILALWNEVLSDNFATDFTDDSAPKVYVVGSLFFEDLYHSFCCAVTKIFD